MSKFIKNNFIKFFFLLVLVLGLSQWPAVRAEVQWGPVMFKECVPGFSNLGTKTSPNCQVVPQGITVNGTRDNFEHDFGELYAGQGLYIDFVVTIENTGSDVALAIDWITPPGAGFSLSQYTVPTSLDPGVTMVFDVRFEPAFGSYTDTLTIISDDPNHSAFIITFTGSGISCDGNNVCDVGLGESFDNCTDCRCAIPWGGEIGHGQSRTAYDSPSVTCGLSCNSETRNCVNNTLEGTATFIYGACSPSCANCIIDGETVFHNTPKTFSTTRSVDCGSTCNSGSRSCNNGAPTGNPIFQYFGCTVDACLDCTELAWAGTILHGDSVTPVYHNAIEPCDGSCDSETRVCTDGTLSLSHTEQTCSVDPCTSCTELAWAGTILHGGEQDAYHNASEPCGNLCDSETRVCTDGTLSLSHTEQTCSVVQPVCDNNADCGACEICDNPGSCASSCVPAPNGVSCGICRECNGGVCGAVVDDISCGGGDICCSGSCTTPACSVDLDCRVGEVCNNAGLCGSVCEPSDACRSCIKVRRGILEICLECTTENLERYCHNCEGKTYGGSAVCASCSSGMSCTNLWADDECVCHGASYSADPHNVVIDPDCR